MTILCFASQPPVAEVWRQCPRARKVIPFNSAASRGRVCRERSILRRCLDGRLSGSCCCCFHLIRFRRCRGGSYGRDLIDCRYRCLRCLCSRNFRAAFGLEVGIGFIQFGLLGQRRALDLNAGRLSSGGLFKTLNGAFGAQRFDLVGQRHAGRIDPLRLCRLVGSNRRRR